MLSKDDVDKMVRDATAHAEEDRKRREEIETRNQADALAFQADRTLRDLGDKVSPEDKADVEQKTGPSATSLKGNDMDAIQREAAELAEALQRVGTAAYQGAASSRRVPRTAAGPAARRPSSRPRKRRSRASTRKSEVPAGPFCPATNAQTMRGPVPEQGAGPRGLPEVNPAAERPVCCSHRSGGREATGRTTLTRHSEFVYRTVRLCDMTRRYTRVAVRAREPCCIES